MKIIVDAMGGDNAPKSIVEGAVTAQKELGTDIILVGRTEEILKTLEAQGLTTLPKGIEIANAAEVVEMEDDPAMVVRHKKDSSLIVGLNMMANGGGDAFVSAGSTGALFTGATLITKRIKGIRRGAMAPVIPCYGGSFVLIDCGANVECLPEYLLQFAYMGSYFSKKLCAKDSPRVGLLNIGTERTKGTDLNVAAFELLESADKEGRINFIGNIEAREAMMGGADVVVCDGYSGNIFLKAIEGTALFLAKEIKGMFTKNLKTKIAAGLVQDGLGDFKKKMDYRETGGTAIVGMTKPVIKAHGSSDAYAIKQAIRQAVSFAQSGIIDEIRNNIDYMKVEKKTT